MTYSIWFDNANLLSGITLKNLHATRRWADRRRNGGGSTIVQYKRGESWLWFIPGWCGELCDWRPVLRVDAGGTWRKILDCDLQRVALSPAATDKEIEAWLDSTDELAAKARKKLPPPSTAKAAIAR